MRTRAADDLGRKAGLAWCERCWRYLALVKDRRGEEGDRAVQRADWAGLMPRGAGTEVEVQHGWVVGSVTSGCEVWRSIDGPSDLAVLDLGLRGAAAGSELDWIDGRWAGLLQLLNWPDGLYWAEELFPGSDEF